MLDASFYDSANYAYDALTCMYDGTAPHALLTYKFTGGWITHLTGTFRDWMKASAPPTE